MMFPIWVVLLILFAHIFGDFILQSREIAENKSDNSSMMIYHLLIYGAVLFICSPFVIFGSGVYIGWAWYWVLINTSFHGMTDSITSHLYKECLKKSGYGKSFFNTIAIDQMIHFIFLFGSLWLIKLVGA